MNILSLYHELSRVKLAGLSNVKVCVLIKTQMLKRVLKKQFGKFRNTVTFAQIF